MPCGKNKINTKAQVLIWGGSHIKDISVNQPTYLYSQKRNTLDKKETLIGKLLFVFELNWMSFFADDMYTTVHSTHISKRDKNTSEKGCENQFINLKMTTKITINKVQVFLILILINLGPRKNSNQCTFQHGRMHSSMS